MRRGKQRIETPHERYMANLYQSGTHRVVAKAAWDVDQALQACFRHDFEAYAAAFSEWGADADLRNEFDGDYSRWIAYSGAVSRGEARIISNSPGVISIPNPHRQS